MIPSIWAFILAAAAHVRARAGVAVAVAAMVIPVPFQDTFFLLKKNMQKGFKSNNSWNSTFPPNIHPRCFFPNDEIDRMTDGACLSAVD